MPFVLGKVKGDLVNILVDSGAMCSLVHQKIVKGKNISITPTATVLTGVTGTPMTVLGEAEVPLEINGEKYIHTCVVVRDMSYNMIMGFDLLSKRGYILNFSDAKEEPEGYTSYLRLNQVVKIMPRTRQVLQLAPARRLDNCPDAWIWPKLMDEPGVWVEEAITPIDDSGRMMVCIINDNDYAVKLDRRTRVADVEGYFGTRVNHVCWNSKWEQYGPTKEQTSEPVKLQEKGAEDARRPAMTDYESVRSQKVLEAIKMDHLTTKQTSIVQRLVRKEHEVFALEGEKLPATPLLQCKVPTGDTRPIKIRAYRMPECHREPLRDMLSKQMEEGIIEPSRSEWSAPIILVPKKGTGELRTVIDYRQLNETLRNKDNYPLPLIEDLLDRVQGAKVYSVMDLKSGYHQVELDPRDAHKTAFICCEGLFQYKRMPMGLATAPPTFQRLLEIVLADKIGKGALVYIDDIILYSNTEEEHEKLLEEVLQRLKDVSLSLKPSKCHFFKEKVDYLGHELSAAGVKPQQANIRKILDFPEPTSLKLLRSFVGMATYYRKFVRNFSKISSPLTALTKKEKGFSWGEAQQQAFEVIKGKLASAPILAYPRYDLEFLLYTDASDSCIGAVLSQVQDGAERVISYGSCMLNRAEIKYSTSEKECLAAVRFTKAYRHYLLGRKFTIVSDHRPLTWLKSIKDPVGRLGRWSIKLSEFDYEIKYRPGRKHENADGMSRRVNAVEEEGMLPEEGLLSVSKLKQAQNKDEWCNCMINYLRHKKLPSGTSKMARKVVMEAGRYVIRTDGLLAVVPDAKMPLARNMDGQPLIMLPNSMTNVALGVMHDHLTAGHLGFIKTLRKMQERFYWEGMYTDVERYTKSCVSCARVKTPPMVRKAPYGHYTETSRPLEKVQMDIVGPISPKSNSNASVILVLTDEFTKYADAYPLPDQKAETIAEVLVNRYFCTHGAPDTIHTDRGRNFVSALIKEVTKLYGVTKVTGSSWHPQSQGQVERTNRVLVEMLKHYTQTQVRNWDTIIPHACLAYNTSVHATTLHTPYELLYGRQARLPVDTMIHKPAPGYADPFQYKKELAERIYLAHQDARQNSQAARKAQAEYYNLKAKKRHFEIGDEVYITNEMKKAKRKNKDDCRKFRMAWLGPAKIIQKVSDIVYKIKMESTGRCEVVHENRMKLAFGHRNKETNAERPKPLVRQGRQLRSAVRDKWRNQEVREWNGETASSSEDEAVMEDQELLRETENPDDSDLGATANSDGEETDGTSSEVSSSSMQDTIERKQEAAQQVDQANAPLREDAMTQEVEAEGGFRPTGEVQNEELRLPYLEKAELQPPFEHIETAIADEEVTIDSEKEQIVELSEKTQRRLMKDFDHAWERTTRAEKRHERNMPLSVPWSTYTAEEKAYIKQLELERTELTHGTDGERTLYPEVRRSGRHSTTKVNLCSQQYYSRGVIYDGHYANYDDVAWML